MSQAQRLKYYRHAARFWLKASELQKARCLSPAQGSESTRADLNFYIVAVQRIREVARMAANRGRVSAARSVLGVFDAEWPRFKILRDLEEHSTGPSFSEPPYGIWYFSDAVADLGPGGSVEFIVRVEQTQESVCRLATALENALDSALAQLPDG